MNKGQRTGFTLVELLVVISIIGILVGLLLPAVQAARESARAIQCANNLRGMGTAVLTFHSTYQKLPPARWAKNLPSWYTLILPYIDMETAFEQWDLARPYADDANAQVRVEASKLFTCPSRRLPDKSLGATPGALGDYAGNAGSNQQTKHSDSSGPLFYVEPLADGAIVTSGKWDNPAVANGKIKWSSSLSIDGSVKDGASNVLLIGEKHVLRASMGREPGDGSIYDGRSMNYFARAGGPSMPIAPNDDDETGCGSDGDCHNYGSAHSMICQFVMCDGHVQKLRADIDTLVLSHLAARNDGNTIPGDVMD